MVNQTRLSHNSFVHDFIFKSLLPAFIQPLTILLTSLASYAAYWITKHVKNKDAADLLLALDEYTKRAVADVYQRTVKSAKASGGWTEAAKQAARDAAIMQVRAAAPTIIASLQARGENVDSTIGQMVEKAVSDLNRNLTSSTITTATANADTGTATIVVEPTVASGTGAAATSGEPPAPGPT